MQHTNNSSFKLFIFLLIASASLALFSCGGKKEPLTEEQKIYAGRWVSADDSDAWIKIKANGSAGFDLPGKNVSGGSITFIDEKTFTISLFGIGETFKVDEPPTEKDGRMLMKLNGVEYYR